MQGVGMCVQVPSTRHEFGAFILYCDNTINKFACEGNTSDTYDVYARMYD